MALLATTLALALLPLSSATAQERTEGEAGEASSPDETPVVPTIAELAVATPELSTLVTALTIATDAGVIDFLGLASDPEADLTVFAPTNDAFAALGATLDDVLADPAGLLTDILAYHVLPSAQNAEQLLAAGTATTVQGDPVTITTGDNGAVYINNSQVLISDIEASNGIIHIIDTVLIPTPPTQDPVFDGARVNVVSAVSGRYLDGDRRFWWTNVDTSAQPRLDDEWILEDAGNGRWRLLNAEQHLYLDADGRWNRYNVDLGFRHNYGTRWEIVPLENGNYLLRSTVYDRYLDYDRNNVDTSRTPAADDEWQLELIVG